MSTAPVFKIVPGLQGYAWGKKGSSSLAAQLGSRSIPDYEIDDEEPYAEVCPSLLHFCPVTDGLTMRDLCLRLELKELS